MSNLHPFEKSGLGVAPFRCVGVERRVGPIRQMDENGEPTGLEVGAPGQPMGTCAHCGTGIADCYVIKDSTGKQFVVGSSCVEKTIATGVPFANRALLASFRKVRLAHEHARDDARVAAARSVWESVPAVFNEVERRAAENSAVGRKGGRYLDFLFRMGGRAGKLKAAREVEAAAKAVGVVV